MTTGKTTATPTANIPISDQQFVAASGRKRPVTGVIDLTTGFFTNSDMHRLPTDEIWHFYLGDPIELLLLHPDGTDELIVLGHDEMRDEKVQFATSTEENHVRSRQVWWSLLRGIRS